MPLFTDGLPKGAKRQDGQRSLNRRLNGLVLGIARQTGRAYGEINYSLNRKLGVTSRTGASDELLRRGIVLAEQYVDQLARSGGTMTVGRSAAGGVPIQQPRTKLSTRPAPTDEQELGILTMQAGECFAIQAGAGTGKTTTLGMLAESSRKRRRGMFLAFNRPVVEDAARKFPSYVECRTGHSVAIRAVGAQYGQRLGQPREPSWKVGARLGISPKTWIRLGNRLLTHKTISYVTLQTLARFCHSAEEEIEARHVPRLRGLADEHRPDLARIVLPYAQRAWKDVQDPEGTLVRFDPNHALKIWALTSPRIRTDFILLDEAQDTNPVMEQVFNAQRAHAQLIMVGDSAQAIYGWRGARDVMTDFEGRQLTLSQSFRFGPALATEANRWLSIVESPLRLRGTPTIDTRVGPLEDVDAVLCRTNGGAIAEIFRLLEEKRRVALVGGQKTLAELAKAAGDLKAGRRATHPDLVLFQSWGELVEYAEEDPDGADLLPLVEIIEDHGVAQVLDAMSRLHVESEAEVTISTAHRAKGREWDRVRIAADFREPASKERDLEGNKLPGTVNLDEARLAYVAVTRARQHLDMGGLSWIADHPDGKLAASTCNTAPPPSAPAPQAEDTSSPWDRLGPPPA
ncbi:UvrD-helicase domain-containing protein [Streptomyces sp. NPDC048213]|uniref:UvrD-helicase domain-containing protein n=1 Tax=Streptomyces sp. NPDC048213 TaxID=3160984 RepID=UPI003408ED12